MKKKFTVLMIILENLVITYDLVKAETPEEAVQVALVKRRLHSRCRDWYAGPVVLEGWHDDQLNESEVQNEDAR